ncbi:MAG: hypothetical protein HKN82_16625 [Akkermansiaceae bacterium]|nr:hypothetical protein [Akkermansiaceae bacterium]
MSNSLHAAIAGLLDHTHPTGPRSHRGLTIVPLFAPRAGKPAYVSLAEAVKHDGFCITEIDSGGSVPNLRVINKTPHNVFLFDGQELKGAKQNRVLNTSILVPAESDVTIPVSCTESGRWSYDSPHFSDSKTVMSPKIRKSKSASVSASYLAYQQAASNQGEVWGEIEELHEAAETSASSSTRAMKDAYDAHKGGLDEFARKMPCEANQSGLLAIRNGRVEGADVLSRPEVYKDLHESLVRSHAMDALVRRDRRQPPGAPGEPDPAALVEAAERFLESARHCRDSAHDSAGLGRDHRLTGDDAHGSALVEADTTVHLALFAAEDDSDPGTRYSIASSRRRRAWNHRRRDED